jgi:hypothetical protein
LEIVISWQRILLSYIYAFSFVSIFISCTKERLVAPQQMSATSDRMTVLNQEVSYTAETIFDKEVTIYPGALLSTKGNGKIIFTKKVNILGESQVFDQDVNVEFGKGTISVLNPTWFGAKGYDDVDDTKAFQKTFSIAKQYPNSINIEIPIGRFKISETLEIGNEMPNGKSINIIGRSMNSNSTEGSCIEWIGSPGKSALLLKNYCAGVIENTDFFAAAPHLLKHNIELRPFDNQISFKNCSFSGCGGIGSANINLNSDNNLQVSEIDVENCIFRGVANDSKAWITESGVIGGLANTKDFYFKNCSFLGYSVGAINLQVTDILKVENCTFGTNDIDIICLLCNTYAVSNYSENSNSFFQSTVSANASFTTMMDNCFYGKNDADYIIRNGSGKLILMNNNFGGFGGTDTINKIKWDQGKLSSIYSIGNFYRNRPDQESPFYNGMNEKRVNGINSFGDMIGTDGQDIREIILKNNNH